MTTNAHEQLSALLDGELPEAEVAMVVRGWRAIPS
jgi:negative regulator of sigma E activity